MVKARHVGYILLGIGIFIVFFAIISDSIGIGKKGIQAAQLLLIQAGVLLTFVGIGFINLNGLEIRFYNLVGRIRVWLVDLPPFAWILLVFLSHTSFCLSFPCS